MSPPVVRDGTAQDRDAILRLRRLVFGETEPDKLDPRFWNWQFMDGPDGPGRIHLVEQAGAVIGHFADVPREFFLEAQPLVGALSIDLMVHPEHRRKGLFLAMGRHGAERARDAGAAFTFAFPVRPETIGGFLKLGWTTVAELPVLVHPLRFRGIARRYVRWGPASAIVAGLARVGYDLLVRHRSQPDGKLRCEEMRELDELYDAFWSRALRATPMVGDRSREFFRWRYLEHPTRSYAILRTMRGREMTGYVVMRNVEVLGFNSTIVVDLLAHDEVSVACLLAEALRFGQRAGTDLVGFMVLKGQTEHGVARRLGFVPSGKRFLLMIHALAPEPRLDDIRWHVSWGDTDVM